MEPIEVDPMVVLQILQQDHPKEYMLAVQKATIMKQGDLILSLQEAIAASDVPSATMTP